MDHVKRKGAFEHAQNAGFQFYLRMRSLIRAFAFH